MHDYSLISALNIRLGGGGVKSLRFQLAGACASKKFQTREIQYPLSLGVGGSNLWCRQPEMRGQRLFFARAKSSVGG